MTARYPLVLVSGRIHELPSTDTLAGWSLAGALLIANNLSDLASATTARTNLGVAIGTNVQAWDADLDALAALSSTGLVARTGSGAFSARTLTAPAAGITVSNGDGVSGNPTLALANDLAALEALSGTNTMYYRSGVDTWSAVTFSGLTFSGGVLTATGSGTVTTTGTPASGNLTKFSGASSITNGDLSGDVTTSGGLTTTLAASGVTAGSYGSGSQVPVITFDAKGRATSASTAAVTGVVPGAGGLIGVRVITATGSGTYTPTSGTSFVVIELQGAGGGGGGVQSAGGGNVAIASAGGGGAWLLKRLSADFSGASYSVGAKGIGGAAGNNAGAVGGNTSFTTTAPSSATYTAGGGSGGSQLGPTAPSLPSGGAAGGTVSGSAADLSAPGEGGKMGIATASSRGTNAGGGSSRYSPGGAAQFWDGANMSVAGASASGQGGGGAGAASGATGAAKAGGNGSDGVIIIWEYS